MARLGVGNQFYEDFRTLYKTVPNSYAHCKFVYLRFGELEKCIEVLTAYNRCRAQADIDIQTFVSALYPFKTEFIIEELNEDE